MEIAVDERRIVIPNEERTIIKTRFGTVETIITTTVDELNNYIFDKYFPRELNYHGHSSIIQFPYAIKDFRGQENKKLGLNTIWTPDNPGYSWSQWLIDEKSYSLGFLAFFGKLEEDFSDYSKSKLKSWQEEAIQKHNQALVYLKNLFFEKKELTKDIFK